MKLSTLEKSMIAIGVLIFFGLILLSIFKDPSSNHFAPKCFLFTHTGIMCPLCGGQRSIHYLFQGRLVDAWEMNHLILLSLVIILAYLTNKLLFKWTPPTWFEQNKWYGLVIYLVGFFILRNIF